MRQKLNALLLLVVATGLAACGSGNTETDPVADTARGQDRMLQEREAALAKKPLERAPPPAAGVVGEVPEPLLERVREDLRQEFGYDTPLLLRRAEAVVWANGALGCPQPGVFYPQVQIAGYHVIFEVGGAPRDYRVTEDGMLTRCEVSASRLRSLGHPAS